MERGKYQWVKEPLTTNDYIEKENKPLPGMSPQIGYSTQVIKPETIYKQQKQTLIFTHECVPVCVCTCVCVVCITIIITEKKEAINLKVLGQSSSLLVYTTPLILDS